MGESKNHQVFELVSHTMKLMRAIEQHLNITENQFEIMPTEEIFAFKLMKKWREKEKPTYNVSCLRKGRQKHAKINDMTNVEKEMHLKQQHCGYKKCIKKAIMNVRTMSVRDRVIDWIKSP